LRALIHILLVTTSLYSLAVFAHPGDHSSIAELNALLTITPAEPSLLIARGATYTRTGEWEKAEQDFLLAKRLDDDINIEFELARLYFHRGEFARSLIHIDRYIETNPHYAPALLLRARTAQATHQTDLALKSWADYLKMVPLAHPGDYLAAARLHASTGRDGLATAIGILDAGMNNIGLIAQLQSFAMQLELDRNEPIRAYQRWRSLENQLGDTAKYKITLAHLLMLTNRFGEARQVAEEARVQLSRSRKTPARESLNLKLSDIEKQLG